LVKNKKPLTSYVDIEENLRKLSWGMKSLAEMRDAGYAIGGETLKGESERKGCEWGNYRQK